MSDGAARLGAEAVDFLLELLELREPRLSGAAAELRPDPAWRLMAAGLMVPQDHEAGSASLADHDDVPVSLIWSEQHSALAYFSPAVGLVPVPHDRLVRHRADVEAVLAAATARMDLPRGRVPHALSASVVKAERDDWSGQIVFGSVQTLARSARRARMAAEGGPPECIMIDSTHLKAHRTAASLLKKGLFPAVSAAPRAG